MCSNQRHHVHSGHAGAEFGDAVIEPHVNNSMNKGIEDLGFFNHGMDVYFNKTHSKYRFIYEMPKPILPGVRVCVYMCGCGGAALVLHSYSWLNLP